MVNNDVSPVSSPDGIVLLIGYITHPETHKPDNHIVGIHKDGIVPDGNPVAGSSLAGNGNVPVVDVQIALQSDRTRNPEQDGPWSRLIDGVAKGPGIIVVIKVVDIYYPAAPSSGSVLPVSFRSWKGGQALCTGVS